MSYDLQIAYAMQNPRSWIKALFNTADNINCCFPLTLISLLKYYFVIHFFRIINIQERKPTCNKSDKEKFSQFLIAKTNSLDLYTLNFWVSPTTTKNQIADIPTYIFGIYRIARSQ